MLAEQLVFERQALALFETAKAVADGESVAHLSARMCPAHRREVLDGVRGAAMIGVVKGVRRERGAPG